MSLYVIRAFIKMREDLVTNAAIFKRLAEIDKTLLIHDAALREILEKLRPLLAPPPEPPKPDIGFHVKEEAVRYADQHGIAFQLIDPKPAKRIIKAYADNFAFSRKVPWTH